MKTKIQTAVRLDQELLKSLKDKAKADHRSLNNYIEMVLQKDVGKVLNATTLAALKEAKDETDLESIDDFHSFFEKI